MHPGSEQTPAVQAAYRQSPVEPTFDIQLDHAGRRANEADLTTTGNNVTRNLN
jgi:hypothetical protein